jgi:hypothetical protein
MTCRSRLSFPALVSLVSCLASLASCDSSDPQTSTTTGGTAASTGGTTATGATTGKDTGGATGADTGGTTSGNAGGSSASTGGTTTGSAGTSAGTTAAAGSSGVVLTCPDQSDGDSWLPANPGDSCTKGCGPDTVGWKDCAKTDDLTACTVPPCALCGLCQYTNPLPACYQTPGDPSLPLPPACPAGTLKSAVCSPPCDGVTTSGLCIQPVPTDATKTQGCVCAARGKWACATYNTTTNTWN